mgnify:CR=1 FL=1
MQNNLSLMLTMTPEEQAAQIARMLDIIYALQKHPELAYILAQARNSEEIGMNSKILK